MKKFVTAILGFFGYNITRSHPKFHLRKETTITVAGKTLVIPGKNPLRFTYSRFPDFASEIARIVKCISVKYPGMQMVDVGANIGDTLNIVKTAVDIPVLSIEGDPLSFLYLKRNSVGLKNVSIVQQYLGEDDREVKVLFNKSGWNTTLLPDNSGHTVELKKLDTIIQTSFDSFNRIKLLKIDTEGFDTIILRGAQKVLETHRPVIYIEYNRDNMNAINENGLETILSLRNLGYEQILFFDDRGRFILSCKLSDQDLIEQLHRYADGKNGLIYYYNLCIVHREDEDISSSIISRENLQNS